MTLIERIEAASGPNRELDAEIARHQSAVACDAPKTGDGK